MRNAKIIFRKTRSLLTYLLTYFFFMISERLLPTKDNYWLFCTWDSYYHTLDNPRAIFEAVKNDSSIIKIVFQKKSGQPFKQDEGTNVRFVNAESLLGAYFLARSRVILLGYGLAGCCSYAKRLTTKHFIVQLWHGIPLKKIGKLFPPDRWWKFETQKYSLMVSSSKRDRELMTKAFSPIPIARVLQAGLPRNDLILKDESELPYDLRISLKYLRDKLCGRKLILYAPTWREQEKDLYNFSLDEIAKLEKLLRKYNAVAGIRGHSNIRHFKAYTSGANSPLLISLNHIPDVNVILRDVTVLVTDYSSIYIDFLLTGRPIIHFVYDIEKYSKGRGFLYDIDDAFAGPAAKSFIDLIRHLELALKEGVVDRKRYRRAFHLFHQHQANPSQEVISAIKMLSLSKQ
jgi:CDP-glycerol glycerophosphotransferase (TagB/SpsB family)